MAKENILNADLCDDSHDMENKRFVSNKLAEKLLQRKFEEFKYGKVHEEAKIACNNFKASLEEIKRLIKDPKQSINGAVNYLKLKCKHQKKGAKAGN
jgi:hypothetical protein